MTAQEKWHTHGKREDTQSEVTVIREDEKSVVPTKRTVWGIRLDDGLCFVPAVPDQFDAMRSWWVATGPSHRVMTLRKCKVNGLREKTI